MIGDGRGAAVVSFLPWAIEMACALGLADQLVGVTHECDYPPEVVGKPVAERKRAGRSLYEVEEELLRALAPDLILTPDLCQVCAPSGNEVARAPKLLPKQSQILWLTPKTLAEIFDSIRELGRP